MTLTYPRDIFGDRTGIWDQRPSINWTGWDIFWARVVGQRLNMGGGSAYIDHADAIGSTVMETGPAGAVQWDVVNGPWGQAWQQTGTRQSQVFAGMDWQVNDPLVPSATREYSDGLGRWMTPDPGGTKVVSLANPQTWNMYAYVTDNPTTLNDPGGLHGNCNSQLTNENGGCEAADPNNVQDSTLVDHGSAKAVTAATGRTVVIIIPGSGAITLEIRSGTHPFRDNNPGDLKSGKFTLQNGAIGNDEGIAIFSNGGVGFRALNTLLTGSPYSSLTLNQAVSIYAPPTENNTAAYQADLQKAIGVSGSTKLSGLSSGQRGGLEHAIAQHEGYYVRGSVTTVTIPVRLFLLPPVVVP